MVTIVTNEKNQTVEVWRAPPQAKYQRKPRRDKGRILLTPRDLIVLRWIGEQFAIRLDHLQRLLARHGEHSTHEAGRVAATTAERVLNRWLSAGLVETSKFFLKEPSWVWLTRSGLRQLNLSFRYWEPRIAALEHVYWANQVRLYIEKRRDGEAVWRSERILRGGQQVTGKRMGQHIVDAEIMVKGTPVALEVELTAKKPTDLAAILLALVQRYHTIWYFTNARTRAAVEQASGALPEQARPKLKIYSLHSTV